jgi:hypothetical protein
MQVLSPVAFDFLNASNSQTHGEVQVQIRGVLTELRPRNDMNERRHGGRYPYPHLISLTPVGKDGLSPEGEAIVVVGKHLSERGLGFYHPKPLPYRRMIASLETANGRSVAFLIDLSWCRFMRQGWYESGGRFLQAVSPPLDGKR